MKKTALIAILTTTLLASSAAFGDTIEKEPPVVQQKDLLGHAFKTQTYIVTAPVAIAALSISQRQFLQNDPDKPPPAPIDIVVDCEIDDRGTVHTNRCNAVAPVKETSDGQITTWRAVRTAGFAVERAPHFKPYDRPAQLRNRRPYMYMISGAAPGEPIPFYRLARITAHLDPLTPQPKVDFATGLVVAYTQLPDLITAIRQDVANLGPFDFPPEAMRNMIAGRLLLECQVQSDLSVICRQSGFDPPENGRFFKSYADAAFRSVRVGRNLANGESAVGVRTVIPVRLSMPQ